MKPLERRKRDVLLVLNTLTVVFLMLGLFIAVPYLGGALISGGMTLLYVRRHRAAPTTPTASPTT